MTTPNELSGIPNAVTKTLICVDGARAGDYYGTMYNPYLPAPVDFQEVRDILSVLEDFFDEISFPQSFYKTRSFLSDKQAAEAKSSKLPKRYQDHAVLETPRGKLASFQVEVLFRRNATWQGKIYWLETRRGREFESTLEMLKLVDQAITGTD